ncbi:MAG: GNAT family N-acetyltransferase [Pseudomonadota bacterium]
MIQADGLLLRPFQPGDEDALVHLASSRQVWRNLRDRFPHPYTRADAEAWIDRSQAQSDRPTLFAIEADAALVGGVGFELFDDVHRHTAEIGYWIGEPYWGRGLATRALAAAGRYALEHFPIERLQATVYAWNPASARVLEKVGYHLDGTLRRGVFKDGEFVDVWVYSLLRGEQG